ncbi:MAG TPA: tetratricopeptide repeat protein [Streptosporangiaceae bacterium]|nr:tetratricopeptide repeat protein [Streptosporangiaceae bacterium]
MEFHLLGPVELWADGQRRELGTAKERLVLANLLLSPGQPVSAETLIDHLWGADPPAKPRQSLYSYIARLRDRLAQAGEVELRSRPGGYVLEIDETTIDVHRFHLLRAQARAIAQSGDEEHAIDLYRKAARLWRAEPLADLSGEWVIRARTSIEDQLLAATLERVDIELRHGHHSDLVGELSDLGARYPYHEHLADRLMRALYCSGRQAEALEVYRRTRARLVDEIGTEANPALRELHQRILEGDPSLLYVPPTRLDAARPPNTLPRDIQITGRRFDMLRLLEDLPHQRSPGATTGSAVNVVTIDGMAGVGKTALAVRLAHELAPRYPDAQLFLNLHAHDHGREALDPTTALGTLLRSLGVPHGRIPHALDDRTALWRTQLARSHALLVLDDAVDGDQVLPLLPGAPGCLTIVTSRRRLVGLDHVRSHSLDVLPPSDAMALFTSVVGAVPPTNDKDLAAVVERCGRLPLGISIAGSKLRHHPAWTVSDLLARLEHDNRRLDELRAADRTVASVFEMSYRELSARQREAFRLFGLHPGPTLTPHAAAALIGTEVSNAERMLDDLHERHLINEPDRGRFSFHDLLHDYALRLAVSETSDGDRSDAIRRILDFYICGADRADRLLYPRRRRIDITNSHSTPYLPDIETKPLAQRWFTTEFDNLLRAADYAGRHGWSTHVAHFGQVLAGHLESRGYWAEAATLHARAVTAWYKIDDKDGTARALADLSLVRFRSGQYDEAFAHAEDALTIYRSVADRAGQAEILDHIGVIRWHQSRFVDALANCRAALRIWRSLKDQCGIAKGLDHSAIYLEYIGRYREAGSNRQRALDIYAKVGDLHGRQMALNNMGDLRLRVGDVEAASDYYEQAAAVTAEMGRQHRAIWLGNMGNIYQHTGRYDDALDSYRKALPIHREIGDRRSEIEALIGIGSTFQRMGKQNEALVHYEKALAVAREISERYEETKALRHIGAALVDSGRYDAALTNFRRALDLADRIGELFETAKTLEGMGSALFQLRDRINAKKYWKRALTLYNRLGVPDGHAIQNRLKDLAIRKAEQA